jgi:hypothetical protein
LPALLYPSLSTMLNHPGVSADPANATIVKATA